MPVACDRATMPNAPGPTTPPSTVILSCSGAWTLGVNRSWRERGIEVRYSDSAREDLLRLFDFLLDRAKTAEDFESAQLTVDVIRDTVERSLSRAPFVYRKAGGSQFLRELLIPFRGAGYVALYEIKVAAHVTVLAVRHQFEDDYHWARLVGYSPAGELRRMNSGRLATWLPGAQELRLQCGGDRLQHCQVSVVIDVGGVDLNGQPPCPILRPAAH